MQIGNHELESPIINAGGLVKTIEDVRLMAATGVGAVLAGSFTLDPREGYAPNGETVYYHDPASGITYNSLGMPNKGMEVISTELQEMIDITHDYGKPFILNVAPVTDKPVEEVGKIADFLERAGIQGLDAIELNASCPNVVSADGKRHMLLSHHPILMGDVVNRLLTMSYQQVPFNSMFVRISPFKGRHNAYHIAALTGLLEIDAIVAFNTFPGGEPLDAQGHHILKSPGGIGGQSGAGMIEAAEAQTEKLVKQRERLGFGFDIIGSNGIHDAESMKRRLDMGAAAVSATTLFWEAKKNWGTAVDKLLRDYAEL